MAEPVSSIRNLGPASDASFARAGISSAEQLRALGPDTAYRQRLKAGSRKPAAFHRLLCAGDGAARAALE